MVKVRLLTGSIVLASAACGGSTARPRSAAAPPPIAGQSITIGPVSGSILAPAEAHPRCPVTAHFEGELRIEKFAGVVRYRWERSQGKYGPVLELNAPAAAVSGPVNVAVKPDGWPITQPDTQLTVFGQLHVLAPVNVSSPPIYLQVTCYSVSDK